MGRVVHIMLTIFTIMLILYAHKMLLLCSRSPTIMYQSNRGLNIPPGIPRAFDVFCCPVGREFDELSLPRGGAFDHYSYGVGNLIASFDFMLRRADFTWRDKSWRRQALMHSK